MILQFKQWMTKNEGFTEPPVERPDQNALRDAEEGREGAFPTYDLPIKKAKKRQKKN